MKKVFIIFLSLLIISETAMAADCCISRTRKSTRGPSSSRSLSPANGFTLGTEFGLGILNPPVADELLAQDTGWLRPSIAWQNNRFSGGLELSAALGFPFWVTRTAWAGIDLDVSVGYEWDINLTNSLAFTMESETFFPFAGDEVVLTNVALDYANAEDRKISSWLMPGIRFTHEFRGVGTLYAEAVVPICLAGAEGAFSLLGLDFYITLDTVSGFGIEASINNAILNAEGKASFFNYLFLIPSYSIGPVYASIGFGIPTFDGGMKEEGLLVTPRVEYSFLNGFMAYMFLTVNGIKFHKYAPPAFGLGVGLSYSF